MIFGVLRLFLAIRNSETIFWEPTIENMILNYKQKHFMSEIVLQPGSERGSISLSLEKGCFSRL